MLSAATILGWAIFAFWALLILPSLIAMLFWRLDRVPLRTSLPDRWPTVSVIVPARNEASRIEAGLRSLLATDYPNIQILAVDDRSTDKTGRVMDRLAAGDSRLQVIHVTELPTDWLGKSHAMHVASMSATGEYLLFTDGDIVFEPDVIRRAVTFVEDGNVDHLTLIPAVISGSWLEDSLVAFFGLAGVAASISWLVPTSFPYAYVGIGAFNLVRRDVYEKVGGHVPIRLDVLDDVKLGKMLKRAGFRQRVLMAGQSLRVRWQESAWGIVRGLEKNAFASMDYSVSKLVLVTGTIAVCLFLPYVGAVWLHDARALPFLASIVLLHASYCTIARQIGIGWRVAPFLPVAGLGIIFAYWRSTLITLRRQGVRWRETFYPLQLLRENRYD
jgi:cellulose synthase/poly-beta-1,6-N-acetylglucosamine synthase-like glycosyltransferase